MKTVLAAALVASAFAWPALAAELRDLPPPDGPAAKWGTLAEPCTHLLKGEIAGGDAAKLAAADPPVRILCLDSPGGSMPEALKLAEFIRAMSIGTRVPARTTCESACALAFMAGSILGDDSGGGTVTNRAIHPTARLGFHAPKLVVEEGVYSEAAVSAAYGLSLEVLSRIVDFFVRRPIDRQDDISPYLMAPSLLSVLMNTHPDQMSYVSTVDEAGRWNIGVWPIASPPDGIDLTHFYRDCANRVMWQADLSALDSAAFFHDWRAHPDFDGFAELRVVVDETGGLDCRYALDPESMRADAISAADQEYFTFDAYGSDGPLSIFAPQTRLADLPH